jgi:hypothetical protein
MDGAPGLYGHRKEDPFTPAGLGWEEPTSQNRDVGQRNFNSDQREDRHLAPAAEALKTARSA